MELPINEVLAGECSEILKAFPENSIDLTVTSPPYDNLRKYNGFVFPFEQIAQQLYRATKVGGVVVWVVADATIKGSETGTSFRQALYFKEIGFNLHDTMIYQADKPPLTHNRYEQKFEYMFVLSKGKPKTFNPITDICNTVGRVRNRKGKFFGLEKQNGSNHDKVSETKETKIIGNVWKYPIGGANNYNHPAKFPEKLAEDHILSWSNPGDIVLDPMCGSGTTLKMAKKNGRNFIGIDISLEYVELSRQRVSTIE